ncbi:unnamed protein product [Diatraea saccharalis]|uniref:Suppressor of fused homolog n=1 Tax=Diatraea saccharalis TaxID=40085 RepID=A0A9N9R5G3_9NEOP|nr:unnamed protein product [Diatraea saccharalis]
MAQSNATGSSGVVRNSALSFVEEAAPAQGSCQEDIAHCSKEPVGQDRMVPAGLKALCEAYSGLYPDQPNPLQVTTRLKYWLGGHDPLDYISMYWNPGKPVENIPAHWHYVSFGLSDLHGDGRVHAGGGVTSGYGLELTLRLAADTSSTSAGAQPPLWPAALLQALARYIFTTGNKFCAGDHISWHAALDGETRGGSRIRHLLVAEDPQLKAIDTPHGTVEFLQVVGCTGRELRAAQRGSCMDVLKLIGEDPRCGAGGWLVTRVSRRVSARGVRTRVSGPAQLAGVTAAVRYHALPDNKQCGSEDASVSPGLSPRVEQEIKETLQRGLSCMSTDRSGPEGHMSTDSFEMSSIERALPRIPEVMQGSWRGEEEVEFYPGVHLIMNAEGASLLPLAIDGRVLHGRHFTWRYGSRAVTLLPTGVCGAATTVHQPYAARGLWMQILIPNPLAFDMSKKVAKFSSLAETDSESDSGDEKQKNEPILLPLTLSWPEYNFKITIVQDLDVLL